MKQKLTAAIIALIVLSSLISCNNTENKKETTNETTKTEHVKELNKKDCKDVHWSHHEGEDGPENWKNLCDGFSECGGNAQSPVNIVTKNTVNENDLKALKFNYGKTKVDIINNSHTVQFNVSGDNYVKINGKDYKLLQFHYHTLSEHTIDGKYFPAEVHFVHKYSDNDFAVIGVMFTEGKEFELFKKYLNKFPVKKGEYKSEEIIDIASLLPENKSYYNYDGSLTTPPCSEVVSWYILQTPVEASEEQIKQFSDILNNNYRPLQKLNNRKIKFFKEQ